MYKLVSKKARGQDNEGDDQRYYLTYIKNKLVRYLINYGTYLKMGHMKNKVDAERTLKKVLFYQKQNPIAHYRLGFLAYRSRRFTEAAS
ncbi:hypothetical protein AOA59_26875, partial [Pseudomonas sp. 2822-15]